MHTAIPRDTKLAREVFVCRGKILALAGYGLAFAHVRHVLSGLN